MKIHHLWYPSTHVSPYCVLMWIRLLMIILRYHVFEKSRLCIYWSFPRNLSNCTRALVSSDDVYEMTTTPCRLTTFEWTSSRICLTVFSPFCVLEVIQTCDINVRGEMKSCIQSIRHYDTQYVNIFETDFTQGSRQYQQ